MNRHHLIAQQCNRYADIRAFLSRMRGFGFHMNDFSTNGILLPTTPSLSDRLSLPLHRGGHPRYNDAIIAQVRDVMRASSWIDEAGLRGRFALRSLRRIQERVRATILRGGPGPIDDLALVGATDLDIDAAVERLLAGIKEARP